jgi:predicted nucleic acid-binding protein
MQKILLDTDVILDLFYDRKPFSDHAARLFSLCESKKVIGLITPVTCSNLYYVLKQTARHGKVVEKLNQLLMVINVLSMDGEVVLKALNSDFKDFEDALQNFSAVKAKNIDVIITRNVKDYRNSELGIMTPENYLKQLIL